MIVVVDDERNFGFPNSTTFDNSEDAIKFFSGWRWVQYYHDGEVIDELWLDHDLGGEDTIMNLVKEMEYWSYLDMPLRVKNIYVHSMNPVGADRVVKSLVHYGYNAKRVGLPNV